MTSTYPLAVSPAELPVDTSLADEELRLAGAEGGDGVFGGRRYPVLSAAAQAQLVTHYQTTRALATGAFDTVRRSARRDRLIAEHLAIADHYTEALVGSVFRLASHLIHKDRAAHTGRLGSDDLAETRAAAYLTILEAALTYDPGFGTNFASWAGRFVTVAASRTRQQGRLTGAISEVDRRVLNLMRTAQNDLLIKEHREPSRAELLNATRAACRQWHRERLVDSGLTGAAMESEVTRRMVRSGEQATLDRRLEQLSVLRSGGDTPFDPEIAERYRSLTPEADDIEIVETDPMVRLLSYAQMTARDGADLDGDGPGAVSRGQGRELRNLLSAPHAQYCWLGAGVADQFHDDLGTSDLVARLAQTSHRVREMLVEA